ncbi:hypothetical protein GOQ30_00675 [Flavobacterium sp. TP390]|uniref:Uncharacterized protein n=1 Tax=Flavobacterium profundi TaxID=1774945 RepID=A0A6I4IJ10_9FLAO|nr:hypothetical protein [Flavobacterium profundi]MVO07672.1 hypothetical protein [Flavobacterium profundi]
MILKRQNIKQLLILFLFFFISTNGFCDTIDYWHVYINNKVVAEFNQNSSDLTIKIKKGEITKKDLITVRYFSDHLCTDCVYGLTALAEIKRKAPEVETDNHFGELTISFDELLDIQKTDGTNKFYFNYHQRKNNAIKAMFNKLLFILILPE